MSEISIVAVCNNSNQEVVIRLQNWELLANGQGHFVLQNKNETDPLFRDVVGICIHQIESTPSAFLEIYDDFLSSRTAIAKHLLPRRSLKIVSGESAWMVNHLKNMTNKKIVFPKDLKLYLAQDLRKTSENWQYYLEFKPKTPLPDIYSRKMIQKIADQLNQNDKMLNKLLKQRPLIEKTRWFKKNLMKGIGNNINPLQIFAIEGDGVKFQGKIQRNDGRIINNPQQLQVLSKKISKQIEKSEILNNILAIQQQFIQPCDSVQLNLQRINDYLSKVSIDLLKKELINCTKQQKIDRSSLLSFLQSQPEIIDSSISKDPLEYLSNSLRFLISLAWRDVSLIIRFKADELLNITAFDIKIIDYQLKEMSKLASTVNKDQRFLLNYLQHLKNSS